MCANADFSDRIAASSAELLDLYRRQQPTAPTGIPTVINETPAVTPPIPKAEKPKPEVDLPIRELYPSVGYLQVQTTAAEMSVPIPNALIVVTAGDRLVALGETDESGLSDLWTLPAPNALDFERPNPEALPAFYTIAVYADGYTSVLNQQVPLYGTIKSMQEVNMIPLPEAVDSAVIIFTTGAPTDLQ